MQEPKQEHEWLYLSGLSPCWSVTVTLTFNLLLSLQCAIRTALLSGSWMWAVWRSGAMSPLLVPRVGSMFWSCHRVFCRPFSIEPTDGILNVGESMQLEVDFEPQTVGNHNGKLIVTYDTGMLLSLPFNFSSTEEERANRKTRKLRCIVVAETG